MDLSIQESEWGLRSNMENFKEVNFEEFKPSAEDFTLAQSDIKIHDQKFQTKTTTYAKDAFKRILRR